MADYAVGREAFGFCDRCGFRYDLAELKQEFRRRKLTGLKVCPTCWDPDHPQDHLGETPVTDPQSLRDPRPDTGRTASVSYFGWSPVGHEMTRAKTYVGTVTVTTS